MSKVDFLEKYDGLFIGNKNIKKQFLSLIASNLSDIQEMGDKEDINSRCNAMKEIIFDFNSIKD